MPRHLIVNADDFGCSPFVNRAIEHVASRGIITSTSVLANMPYAGEAAHLSSICPGLTVGLHVNLTEGCPVLPGKAVASLVDESGNFLGWPGFLSRLWTGRVNSEHLEAEIVAQMERLRGILGHITHIDSHQHIHVFPQVFQASLRAATVGGIARFRTTWRYFGASDVDQRPPLRAALGHFRQKPLAGLGLILKTIQRTLIKRRGFRAPDYLLTPVPSISPQPAELAVLAWSRVFMQLPDGIFELLFHPGAVPGEVELLTCNGLRGVIERSGIELVSYLRL